jgi:hypothetical protein
MLRYTLIGCHKESRRPSIAIENVDSELTLIL